MTDLTMAKVKALYQDMVDIEQNVQATSRAMTTQLAILEKHNGKVTAPFQSRGTVSSSLKTVVLAASIAFGLGVTVNPGSRISLLFAGIPLCLGLAWALIEYLDKGDQPLAQEERPTDRRPDKPQLTSEAFIKACQEARIEGRDKDACEDVLLKGLAIEEVAKKHKMWPAMIERKLEIIYPKIN